MNIKDFYYFWTPLRILIKSKCNIIHERDTRKTDGTARKRIPSAQTGREIRTLMSPGKTYPEVNFWSVTWGLVMAVIFSAAAAYLGLKVGQVFEAAIPIAIIAVGISSATNAKAHWVKTS